MRKFQDYEAPYLTMKQETGPCRVAIRKTYVFICYCAYYFVLYKLSMSGNQDTSFTKRRRQKSKVKSNQVANNNLLTNSRLMMNMVDTIMEVTVIFYGNSLDNSNFLFYSPTEKTV